MAPGRIKRPMDFIEKNPENRKELCPFCPGHEKKLESVVFQRPSKKWKVRLVKNKYPIVHPQFVREGYGFHEVLIESPAHHKKWADLSLSQITLILKTYQKRLKELYRDPKIKHVEIFKNQGRFAGASLEHPHSQILALSLVPPALSEELRQIQNYHTTHQSCLFCDWTRGRHRQSQSTVDVRRHFLVLCPYASRFPMETWIIPKRHESRFECANSMGELAAILKTMIQKINQLAKHDEFNLILKTAPQHSLYDQVILKSYHWSFQIVPRLETLAGLELATGLYVNSITPEQCAKKLRTLKIR
jgi:UDPglucose--hexose-1-phosphate uridylyltransferase